jgi:hypothetical protein
MVKVNVINITSPYVNMHIFHSCEHLVLYEVRRVRELSLFQVVLRFQVL